MTENIQDARIAFVTSLASLVPKRNQAKAIRQHLSKPAPMSYACGCMGQAPICDKDEGKPWGTYKVEPLCRCAMNWVEQVDGRYYQILTNRTPDGIIHTAKDLGPIGGPYLKDPGE